MKKPLLLLINLILIVSCTSNIGPDEVNDKFNNSSNSELKHEYIQLNYSEYMNVDIIEETNENHHLEADEISESFTKEENNKTLPQITDEPVSLSTNTNNQHTSPDVSEPEQPSPPTPDQTSESRVTEVPPKVVCTNAWYDENQPCDWIPDNLKPLDELGRSVPSFTTSQEAWNWGEAQMDDTSSNWYLCGFTRMEGNTNDGTIFYYAYMKSCPNE